MANRREFLNQLQDQLSSWTDWVRQLDDQALASAEQVRPNIGEYAKAVYEQRAIQVRDLIQQGRGQFERLAEASDDAWDGVSGGAEQAWATLKDAAASLAAQPSPAANEPTVQAVVSKPRPVAKPGSAAKPRVAVKSRRVTKPKPAAKKKAATRKKPVKAARSKAKARSPAKAKRSGPKRKVAAKRKTAAKRRPAARKSAKSAKRRPARKK